MKIKQVLFAALMCSALTAPANAAVWDIGFTIISGWDAQGDPDNTTITVDLASALGFAPGSPVVIDAIGWDVTIASMGDSWLSEATVLFSNSDGDGVNLTPGAGDDFAGGPTDYSSLGLVDLASVGIDDIMLLSDGVLVLEFFELFDDVPDAVDSIWAGTLSVNARVVPVPAALPLLLSALGLTGFLARRRG